MRAPWATWRRRDSRSSTRRRPPKGARAIKTPEEIACSKRSMACVMAAEQALQDAARPGITENALWAEFHRHVIANDGDYVETRLLSAGERTNPWFQETGDHAIQAGDLIAHDTDVVGPHGYYGRLLAHLPLRRRPADAGAADALSPRP